MREALKGIGKGTAIVIALVAAALLVGGVVWIYNVATSGVRGQGDAQIQKNSAENWPKQQAEFERMYNSILAADKNITIAWEELQADKDNQIKQTNYSGLKRSCNDTVASYNSRAREYLAKDFRDARLPQEIDQTKPETDCMEDK